MQQKTDISELENLLRPNGLLILGAFDASDQEAVFFGDEQPDDRQIILVGNAGSSIWPAFTASPENGDGLPHPLDRWSRRIGTAVAAELDARVVFPFEGPPYPAFLNWTERSGQAFPSPLSMFIHGEYGLWHAYRFALLLPGTASRFPQGGQAVSPCLSCTGQPCLTACPVDAFTGEAYRVGKCVAYLAGDEHSDCRQAGCGARRACPFEAGFQYRPVHARFHMEAFLLSQIP